MKFISWNVNGLRACKDKGFVEAFKQLDADFFCLQETKMQAGQLDLSFEGYESYWNYAEKKGYSGTAIYTRYQPLSVTYGIDVEHHDREGRVITLEMPAFFLVTVYTPNSQDGLRRLDYRMTWEDDFRRYLLALDARKPVIVCGDLNVAHQEIDLKNPKTNRRNAGFTDEERAKFIELLGAGLTARTSIPGGPTVSGRGRRMRAGASTTSSPPSAWTTAWSAPTSTRTSTAPTIAPSRWCSTFDPPLPLPFTLRHHSY